MPGKVLSVNGSNAVVDFSGNQIHAEAGLVKIKPGDSVLVHAGCILQVMSDEEADSLAELFKELENL